MTAGRSAATAAFWRDVVERHGLLTGWFQDRYLYHRIGYLIQIGDSIQDLIDLSRSQTHSAFREALVDRTRKRLDLTADKVSLLRYGKDNSKSTDVLLLMNVETVLGSTDIGSRFSFHAYVDNWSLEHIHAQNSEAFEKEAERRDWLRTHKKKIEESDWSPDQQADVDELDRPDQRPSGDGRRQDRRPGASTASSAVSWHSSVLRALTPRMKTCTGSATWHCCKGTSTAS